MFNDIEIRRYFHYTPVCTMQVFLFSYIPIIITKTKGFG
jgi:hypothetical protein